MDVKIIFFNYYDRAYIYFPIYTKFNFYKNDFTLLKYLFILSAKEIDISSYLKISNIENVYSTIDNIFNLGKIFQNYNNIEQAKEEPQENKNIEEFNFADLNNLSDEDRGQFFMRYLLNRRLKNKDKSQDDFNVIMQWQIVLQFLILILKDDSSCYFSLISIYDELLSSRNWICLII